MNNKKIVVVLPTYNEKKNIKNIASVILSQQKYLPKYDLNILFSDSHSPDGTYSFAQKLSSKNPQIHALDVKERGIGVGIYLGHKYAVEKLGADILVQTDADLQQDPADLPRFIKEIEKSYDLVIGSRLVAGGANQLEWHRRIFTSGASWICRILWGTFKLHEFTNSYRAFSKELFEKVNFDRIPWKSRSYVYQPAFLNEALLAGAKWVEIPIVFKHRSAGLSKIKASSYIKDLMLYSVKVAIRRRITLIKFLIVGTIGYLVNSIALGLLNAGEINFVNKIKFGLLPSPVFNFLPVSANFFLLERLFWATVVAIELSIISNFIFNDNWTFKKQSDKPLLVRFFQYNTTSIGSPIIQIVAILLLFKLFHVHEQIGLVVGILLGLIWNWLWASKFVWRSAKTEPTKPVEVAA